MPDGSSEPRFDAEAVFLEGSAFVQRRFQPKDHLTQTYIECLGCALKLLPVDRPKSHEKLVRCLSDFLVGVRQSEDGLLCWPMDANTFTGGPYSQEIATKVRSALKGAGLLWVVQRHRKGLSVVYGCKKALAPSWLKFEEHEKVPLLQVRAAKANFYHRYGRPKGKSLKLSEFEGLYETPQAEMEEIIQHTTAHPLVDDNGTGWSRLTRVFNDGRLDHGGRLYCGYQSQKKERRVSWTIDGEPVCEVDIKASFLFIGSRLIKLNKPLPSDPYSKIRFVRRKPELRDLGKILVSSIISKPNLPLKFPKSDEKDEAGRTIPLKDFFNLPASANVMEYVEDVLAAYPFLKNLQNHGSMLMYLESQIIVDSMLELVRREEPIVTYPIHDCLICKEKDVEEVVEVLRCVMRHHLGAEPVLDIVYRDNRGKETRHPQYEPTSLPAHLDWWTDESPELIED